MNLLSALANLAYYAGHGIMGTHHVREEVPTFQKSPPVSQIHKLLLDYDDVARGWEDEKDYPFTTVRLLLQVEEEGGLPGGGRIWP
jgi:hypothetical protein